MRFVIELEDKFVTLEIGDIVPEDIEVEEVTTEEVQVVKLPLGFQPPPVSIEEEEADSDEEEDEEIDCL